MRLGEILGGLTGSIVASMAHKLVSSTWMDLIVLSGASYGLL